jgi:hypothetical protein
LEASAVAPALAAFLATWADWSGTMKELHEALGRATDEATRRLPDWPKSPSGLGDRLRRLAPNLRRAGVQVTIGERTNWGIPVTLVKTGEQRSPSSPRTPDADSQAETGPRPSERRERAGVRYSPDVHQPAPGETRESLRIQSGGECGEHCERPPGAVLEAGAVADEVV